LLRPLANQLAARLAVVEISSNRSVTIREHLPQSSLPTRPVFPNLTKVATKRPNSSKLSICLLSPHPLVLSEFERLLSKPEFKVISKQLESTLAPDLRSFEPPKAQVYVIDAHAARQATGALLSNILERYSDARLIVVGEQHQDSTSFSLLRLGVKGILTYSEARDQLIRALPLVANGGFWCRAPFFPVSWIRSCPARRAASKLIPWPI